MGANDEKVHVSPEEEEAASIPKKLGMDVTWKRYDKLGYWFQVPEEIDGILKFLSKKTYAIRL